MKNNRYKNFLFIISLLVVSSTSFSKELDELDLFDEGDLELLKGESDKIDSMTIRQDELDIENLNDEDDLESLKSDVGTLLLDDLDTPIKKVEDVDLSKEKKASKKNKKDKNKKVGKNTDKDKTIDIFDVGEEEDKLVELSKFIEGKIPVGEWKEIASTASKDSYTVQKGDTLWKISRSLFGTGFYYSKIWSLNPHITNPHEIEPDMVLVFDTGDVDSLPTIQVGEFKEMKEEASNIAAKDGDKSLFNFKQFGDSESPEWLDERKKLIDQGVYFQYASEETYGDLRELADKVLQKEYERYKPPHTSIIITEPGDQYDSVGFDKESKIVFNYNEGFFLNTYVTSNVVQDFGEINSIPNETLTIGKFDTLFVKFDPSVQVKSGDRFSVYSADGKVEHPVSDRDGYRYTIVGHIETVRQIDHLWECVVTDVSGVLFRHQRITSYMPKISKIHKTFIGRNVESAIIGSYKNSSDGLSFGDVVYLDRGRSDGVELGTVFEAYSFYDRGTNKRITPNPTYKIGELTVITLTDNFATALISHSSIEMKLGTLAFSKSMESAARASRIKDGDYVKGVKKLENSALEELDIELNLDELSDDLLDKADEVRLTQDEVEELERQERKKSVIKDHERDLKELEKLEQEIENAEVQLNESKLDEDKFLEKEDLDKVEGKIKDPDPNAYESLDELEKEFGKKYMDEDLNAKENPYGLTDHDIEEIDDLLNSK